MGVNASHTLVGIGLFVIMTGAIPGTSTIADEKEPQTSTSEMPRSSLEEQIEIAKIQLAIRLQEVEVAKAERQLITPSTNDATDDKFTTAKAKLAAAESNVKRVKTLQENRIVSERVVRQAEAEKLAAKAELAAYEEGRDAQTDKTDKLAAVHDARIRLLELRAKLAEAKLGQLKNRLKRQ